MPRRSEKSINSLNVGSGLNIPTRKATINDLSQLPDNYCSTPGGTLFATTPGGTRIIYDRSFLLKMRNSPIASTPPKNLPYIAGVTTISPESCKENKLPALAKEPLVLPTINPVKAEKRATTNSTEEDSAKVAEVIVNPNEEQFSMDM